MNKLENKKVYMWIQCGKLIQAIFYKGTLQIYKCDSQKLILKRTGLNKYQMKKIMKEVAKSAKIIERDY